MSTKMLIDARHPEETRVTVVKGNRVEEFDYESSSKAQLKGNIYLAKVTRVEPSLQAAFVDYGGNRHGFLAFSEIHPDYYQIPVEDREELLEEDAKILDGAAEAVADDKDEAEDKANDAKADTNETPANAADDDDHAEGEAEAEQQEIDDALRQRRTDRMRRRYKIQEVIKRRQILLIQVVKEERGTKGAALTTYLSLPGRYSVLMPNTTSGGGISRKIGNVKDRKRLKGILTDMDIPAGMGCIIRTAGLNRTKTEIKRDIDYLRKLWEGIRAMTLKSIAPALIYEEGNLIKRTIRDLYDRNIDEIQVEGEDGYKTAKDFMKLLMPSHAKKVQHYADPIPLFHRYQVESQLEGMFSPNVTLKSGGYLVINPTEALIAVDVNSGRSTKEHNIEETALKTNLEAADEVARQLRLRDMAGLVVIDFIDMEDRGNIRKVERRMKDALKNDRARVQVSRLSSLGLMELSRQRLRPNLVEASTRACPTCEGTGRIRTVEAAALQVIRALEEEGIRARSAAVTIRIPAEVAIYLLNKKRKTLAELESLYTMQISIRPTDETADRAFEMDRVPFQNGQSAAPLVSTPIAQGDPMDDIEDEIEDEEIDDTSESVTSTREEEDEKRPRRRRRRRGRRGGRRHRDKREDGAQADDAKAGEKNDTKAEAKDGAKEKTDDKPAKKPTRRRSRKKASDKDTKVDQKTDAKAETKDDAKDKKPEPEKAPAKKPAVRKTPVKKAAAKATDDKTEASAKKAPAKKAPTKKAPAKKPAAKKAPAKANPKSDEKKPTAKASDAKAPTKAEEKKDDKPKKKGWWNRTLG